MLSGLEVKVGPQVYRYDSEAFELVPEILNEFQAKKVLVVHGEISYQKAKPFLIFLQDERYQFQFHQYTGQCSYVSAEAIKEIVLDGDIDFVIGVGGGKLADLVGFASHLANKPFGLIPTLVSNCAPWTPLSVMYKESGESEGVIEFYLRQATFVLAQPELLIDAPTRYFVSGMADTIAKWYESDAILSQAHLQDVPFLKMAKYTTVICKDVILTQGQQALKDMEQGIVSPAFKNVAEVIFAVGGLVGGLGDEYARIAAVHAMHDGLCKYIASIPQNYFHGEIVAYGILYQLALEQRFSEINSLLPFYTQLNLPVSLKEMGIEIEGHPALEDIIEFVYTRKSVHMIPLEIDKASLTKAVFDLENYPYR